MEQLVNAVQKLSMARDLDTILTVVKQAARELTGADGATLVLREQDQCYYIEENAIAPLWKGERFPIDQCISGWAMQNRQAAVIEDILQDARIPQEVYQQTFVKSMVMVPIRTMQPIGAIGNYWVEPHQPQVDQVKLLQALADTTAVAIENVQVYAELEERIQQRTAELHQLNGVLLRSNQELEQFAYVASHDLQEPLRTVASYTELLAKKYRGQLDEKAEKYINYVVDGASRMQQLINDLLMYSRVGRQTLQLTPVDCNQVVQQVCKTLEIGISENNATITYDPLPTVLADVTQLTQLVQNLIGNAIKYRGEDPPVIHITATQQATEWVFSIQDNGIGIDPQYTDRIFILFQRLHTRRKYSGTGIGLAICKKIVELHQGRIWVESQVGQGSTFYVALPDRYEPQAEVLLEAMV
ncbi:hypothetical protein BST81_25685 [Leptolyngbya sp. 'hensonii']|nr:hypothetical protein BST81_25685 [Leptolyngbya sp. 'hensonii']